MSQRRTSRLTRPSISRLTPLLILLVVLSSRKARAQYIPRSRRHAEAFPQRDTDSQDSTNNDMWLVSYEDFCLYGPPDPFQYIWETGLDVVSWCSQAGHGTRLIPDGTLQGVTFVRANDWVQVSGTGDFTKINIAPGDAGGQFDSDQNTPDGAIMYVSDDNQSVDNWVTLISADTFCVRACTGDPSYCPTTYDQMGCWWFTGEALGPSGVWQDCASDDGDPPGVVDGTTFTQCGIHKLGRRLDLYAMCLLIHRPSTRGRSQLEFLDPPAGETQQQGVTQINAAQGSAASADSSAVDQLLDRRDDSTTTSGGQCCWTTYTPSVIGGSATSSGAVATGAATASASGGGTSAQATTGQSAASTASGGSLAVGATSGAASASHAASGSGTAVKASGSLAAGNGTASGNSTGNSSSWATRVSIEGWMA
ncbi:hypothetical protein EHS25_009106 [Saitozyma podzolica]|uniref:Uncharacterized protein n=1 Tax=Saitozyma podzolica TaxID=1890683 RepID=A0A427YL13_9TREE|nr:hypothetical protein EHS25_009106 [Saitozyma podzolica]